MGGGVSLIDGHIDELKDKRKVDFKMTKELKISETLKELGIPANLTGYFELKYAIEVTMQDIYLIHHITKKLYPMIATKFNATPSKVERAIRHAIEVGWCRGNIELQNKLFGYTVDATKCKPTNSEFIGTVADWLNMTCKEGDTE